MITNTALISLAVLLPSPAAAESLPAALQAAREQVLALRASPRPAPGGKPFEVVREIALRSNRSYALRRLLISSESRKGSEILRREASERARGSDGTGSRYIGWTFPIETLPGGAVGIKPAVQRDKSDGGMKGSYRGPGVAAFEFMAAGAHDAFTRENPPMEKDKPVRPTDYDAGVHRALVVEIAFDELDALFRGRREFLDGMVTYYARGGFNREVYDTESLLAVKERQRFYSPSLELNNYLARFQENNRAKRLAGDKDVLAEEDRIRAMMREAALFEEQPRRRNVKVRVDWAAQTKARDALVLEFQD